MLHRVNRLVTTSLLLALAAAPAHAVALTGNDLLLPVVARAPGELGTQWRTDLVVTNTSRSLVMAPVQLTFMRAGEPDQTLGFELGPLGSVILEDVVRTHFGHEQAHGMVRVTTPSSSTSLTARARIYNVGGAAGEYGQGVPALPTTALPSESFLSGLSGVGGNRTNVGIANPSDSEVHVFVSLFETDGSFRGAVGLGVPARGVLQLNDVFTWLGTAPFDGATIQIQAEAGVYTYASVVRNDTGDAVFVTGAGQLPEAATP